MEQNHLTISMTPPDFTENSTFGPINMSDDKGKWVMSLVTPAISSHPDRLTFCS